MDKTWKHDVKLKKKKQTHKNPTYYMTSFIWNLQNRQICTLATSWEELTHWKRLWCWEGLGAGGEGDDRGWDGWMASLTQWMWVWVNSRSWWWTGRPGVLRFMGSQRVRHNWATELNWTDVLFNEQISEYKYLSTIESACFLPLRFAQLSLPTPSYPNSHLHLLPTQLMFQSNQSPYLQF